jgi:hypothetical protein
MLVLVVRKLLDYLLLVVQEQNVVVHWEQEVISFHSFELVPVAEQMGHYRTVSTLGLTIHEDIGHSFCCHQTCFVWSKLK